MQKKLATSPVDSTNISLAVPIFHGYSHEAACQVKYNPRLLSDYHMADGENIEHLWSSLGLLAYITKEMSNTRRLDLLVDSLLHLGEKVLENAPVTLASRLKAAQKQTLEAEAEINHLCRTVEGTYI
jgi:hypothetical protein